MAHKIDKVSSKHQKFSDIKSQKEKLKELLDKLFKKFKKQ